MIPRRTPRLRPGARGPRRGFAAAVLVAAAVVTGGPALAQEADAAPSTTPPTTTRPAPASPGRADPDAFRDLATQLNRNERELVELEARLAMAEARLVQLTDQLAETQRQLDATRAELERMRQIVRSRAAFIYSHSHTTTSIVVDIERVEDIASGKKYAESATRSDIGKIDQLAALADALDALRRQLEVDRNDQEAERDRLRDATDQLRALVAKQRRLLDEAGSITVIGDPELTAEQMAAWFDARGARYRLMGGTTIAQLAQLYVEEGAAERVRPELAFVQAILETGSFGNAVDNNFAGIGACDSCTGQIPFSSPREGVRGQIQMLRNYADPGSRAANLANPPSAPIYGSDPARAANAYDTFFAKGRVPTWNLMGNGNWATDPGYAPKVLTLYFQLMSFATRRA